VCPAGWGGGEINIHGQLINKRVLEALIIRGFAASRVKNRKSFFRKTSRVLQGAQYIFHLFVLSTRVFILGYFRALSCKIPGAQRKGDNFTRRRKVPARTGPERGQGGLQT
jgi:hypothetical protein